MGNALEGDEAERVRVKMAELARVAGSHAELARLMKGAVTATTIGAVVSGKYPPGLPIAVAVARASGLALEELLKGDPPEGPNTYEIACKGCKSKRRARLILSRGYVWRALPFGWLLVQAWRPSPPPDGSPEIGAAVCSPKCLREVERADGRG